MGVLPLLTASHLDERSVAAIWERQAFDAARLAELGIRVVFRGVPSDAGGPDYQGAILAQGDRLVEGDVEFHVESEAWYRHGHDRNRAYDRVILHVVWTGGERPTVTAAGAHVPTFALEHAVGRDALTPPAPLLAHPCVLAFSCLTDGEVGARIQEAGLSRLHDRADLLAADVEAAGADQALYSALLEACGYASNRAAFRALAEALPLAWLLCVPSSERLSTLLDAAALAGPAAIPPPARLPQDAWRLSRLRPANDPVRRLAGIAALLDRLGPRPAEMLTDAVARARTPGEIRRFLTVAGSDGALIGAGRADEIAVSVVLPFVYPWEPEASHTLYLRYPSPPHNRWTRLMLDLLKQSGHDIRVRTAPQHQGLHWLYHNFCRQEGRQSCPVCGTRA